MVVAWVRVVEPGSSLVAHIFAVETVLIVATQMAISILVVRTTPTLGIVRALTPAVVAGLVVGTGDVAGWSLAFETSPTAEIVLSILLRTTSFSASRSLCPSSSSSVQERFVFSRPEGRTSTLPSRG
jgi:hypothetical protein